MSFELNVFSHILIYSGKGGSFLIIFANLFACEVYFNFVMSTVWINNLTLLIYDLALLLLFYLFLCVFSIYSKHEFSFTVTYTIVKTLDH